MSLPSKVLRPGLLVGLKTSITGDNVEYVKTELEEEHTDEFGVLVSSWKTDKSISDAAEHERAVKVRSKARSFITSVCARSDFGYLCPEEREADLEAAIKRAVEVCAEFNLTAQITEVNFFTITGRIAVDDAQAVRAIKSELNSLLEIVETSIKAFDVGAARDAMGKAKKLGMMLAPEAQKSLEATIDLNRSVAIKIAKAIKAGEQVAEVIDATTLAAMAASRTAFLDLDGETEMKAPSDTTGRALDLEPGDDDLIAQAPDEAPRELDLELEEMLS